MDTMDTYLKRENERLKVELKKARDPIWKNMSAMADLEAENDELKAKNDELKAKYRDLEFERRVLKNALVGREFECARLEDRLTNLANVVGDCSGRYVRTLVWFSKCPSGDGVAPQVEAWLSEFPGNVSDDGSSDDDDDIEGRTVAMNPSRQRVTRGPRKRRRR